MLCTLLQWHTSVSAALSPTPFYLFIGTIYSSSLQQTLQHKAPFVRVCGQTELNQWILLYKTLHLQVHESPGLEIFLFLIIGLFRTCFFIWNMKKSGYSNPCVHVHNTFHHFSDCLPAGVSQFCTNKECSEVRTRCSHSTVSFFYFIQGYKQQGFLRCSMWKSWAWYRSKIFHTDTDYLGFDTGTWRILSLIPNPRKTKRRLHYTVHSSAITHFKRRCWKPGSSWRNCFYSEHLTQPG